MILETRWLILQLLFYESDHGFGRALHVCLHASSQVLVGQDVNGVHHHHRSQNRIIYGPLSLEGEVSQTFHENACVYIRRIRVRNDFVPESNQLLMNFIIEAWLAFYHFLL